MFSVGKREVVWDLLERHVGFDGHIVIWFSGEHNIHEASKRLFKIVGRYFCVNPRSYQNSPSSAEKTVLDLKFKRQEETGKSERFHMEFSQTDSIEF